MLSEKEKVSIDTWIKLGTYVAGGIAIAYGVKKLLNIFSPSAQQEKTETKNIEAELETEKKKSALTYPLSQYSTFANIIETAGFDIGTDEDAIYSVFRKLKNNADYLQLKKAWGSPNRKIYDWGFGYNMTLPQYIRWEMSNNEVKKINAILQSKGIKYRV